MDGFESNWPISLSGRETDKPETTKKQAKDFFREKWTVLQRAYLIYSRIDYNPSPKRPWSFPGGAVVKKKKKKNPSANAGEIGDVKDKGSIPGSGRKDPLE